MFNNDKKINKNSKSTVESTRKTRNLFFFSSNHIKI